MISFCSASTWLASPPSSSSNRVRRDSVGQAAVGAQAGGIAGGPEGLRAVEAAVCARAGVIHHLQLQPVGRSLSSCSSACWSMDLCVELSKSKSGLVLNAITNPSIHSTRKTKQFSVLFRTCRREIAHPDRGESLTLGVEFLYVLCAVCHLCA